MLTVGVTHACLPLLEVFHLIDDALHDMLEILEVLFDGLELFLVLRAGTELLHSIVQFKADGAVKVGPG